MFVLSADNLTEYLKQHMPQLDYSKPLSIISVGDGSLDEDGDGFLNFVYRVTDGKHHIILKQSRANSRIVIFDDLPEDRSRFEYDSMEMRRAIVPEYIPALYFCDDENHIFACEDVSYLKIVRFQWNRSIIFPNLGRQIAEYLAKTHFFTSEYYLDTSTYRRLTSHFMNDRMRQIFDTDSFISQLPQTKELIGMPLDPRYEEYLHDFIFDRSIILDRHRLRHIFMTKAETLIHGDFHTSNIFADSDELKVIDMEYTFMGPLSYDLGYFAGNIISQYASACFRPFSSEDARLSFKAYLLSTLKILFDEYFRIFFACWDEHAKPLYQNIPELKDDLRHDILQEAIGFAANANLSRTVGLIPYPDFDIITDANLNMNAVCLSVSFDYQLLKNRLHYTEITDVIDEVISMEKLFIDSLCPCVS